MTLLLTEVPDCHFQLWSCVSRFLGMISPRWLMVFCAWMLRGARRIPGIWVILLRVEISSSCYVLNCSIVKRFNSLDVQPTLRIKFFVTASCHPREILSSDASHWPSLLNKNWWKNAISSSKMLHGSKHLYVRTFCLIRCWVYEQCKWFGKAEGCCWHSECCDKNYSTVPLLYRSEAILSPSWRPQIDSKVRPSLENTSSSFVPMLFADPIPLRSLWC